ncbi:MAG: hypothetical protein JEZ00_05765 [Anaerolineaceae bacterium]|nr:hypothetical protein [Anaerolineaceae bacterium]
MTRAIQRYLSNHYVLAVLMISLTAVLTHGIAIPELGYYHDDWYMLWSGAFRGTSSLISLFSTDRPFMGIIYSGFYALIKDHIWGWHVLALLFRVSGACFFYWILNLVWPRENKSLYVLAGMLFVIFPGFLAQPNAATKVMQLMGYAVALLSIALTLKAASVDGVKKRYIFILLALLSMAYYLLIYEYMIGLELMRVSLLFWVIWQGSKSETKASIFKVIRTYIPYIAILGLFLIWRLFIFDSSRGPTNFGGLVRSYLNEPGYMSLRLLFQTIKDFFSASLFAWFEMAYTYIYKASFTQMTVAVLLAGVVVFLAVVFLQKSHKVQEVEDEERLPIVLISMGAVITLGAIIPVVASNRIIDLHDVYKAYALHPSAGVIILLLGLVLLLKPKSRTGFLVALLALSVVTQFMNTARWATYWDVQKNFWWQVTWRAPEIERNTLVMAYAPEDYQFQQDYEIWGPLNLIYWDTAQEWPEIQAEILNQDTAVELYKQSFLEPHVRDIYLPKYYSHFLLFSQPEMNSCVHTIDGRQPVYSANERVLIQEVGNYSNLEMIDTSVEQQVPPETIFGSEPAHDWCYFYQKAELARQKGDWQQIGNLYDEMIIRAFNVKDTTEYLVFIEGLVNAGRVDDAAALLESNIGHQSADHFAICNQLSLDADFLEAYGYQSEEIFLLVCESIDQ